MPKKEIKAVRRKSKTVPKKIESKSEKKFTLTEDKEMGEFEITKTATETKPEKKVRFPKETKKYYQMMPDEFQNAQNAIDAYKLEKREVEVYADSIESFLGYDSLIRVMNKWYGRHVAYLRSEAGGSLSLEEAREAVYRRNLNDEEAIKLFDELLRYRTDSIGFWNLLELNDYSPAMAQNLWEMIKREAALEFESGHRAAAAFEPADYMTDCWNRASYLGLRESLCEEWRPQGGIELTMIDAIAQAWLMLQHWTEQSVRRSKTRVREENYEFQKWKQWQKEINQKQWDDGFWDRPYVSERNAVEHAAQMADRWQRMYFRAIRSLRDWRRYSPQVTINNPNQVNIAADGGQQINVNKTDSEEKEIKKINS